MSAQGAAEIAWMKRAEIVWKTVLKSAHPDIFFPDENPEVSSLVSV